MIPFRIFEKLDPRKHDIGDYIDDFMKSDAPQFKGKSKEKIRDMALAAYRAARKEAGLDEGLSTKDKGELYRLTTLAMKAMPGSGKQKDIIQKLNAIRVKNKMKPISEADGCWQGFKKVGMKKKGDKMVPNCVPENIEEGKGGKPESFEAQYKRRVVKTTKPDHKEKGYAWRIKGKDRPEISIKLYKSKPDFAEFKKQLRRVAGHEFG